MIIYQCDYEYIIISIKDERESSETVDDWNQEILRHANSDVKTQWMWPYWHSMFYVQEYHQVGEWIHGWRVE